MNLAQEQYTLKMLQYKLSCLKEEDKVVITTALEDIEGCLAKVEENEQDMVGVILAILLVKEDIRVELNRLSKLMKKN